MQTLKQHAFTAIICVGIILMFTVGGFIMGGVLMGIMSTIGIWMSIKNLPNKVQSWLGKWPLLSDLLFLKLSFAVFMLIGTGPTIFMALMTQMVLLGLLLKTLKPERKDNGTLSSIRTLDAVPC